MQRFPPAGSCPQSGLMRAGFPQLPRGCCFVGGGSPRPRPSRGGPSAPSPTGLRPQAVGERASRKSKIFRVMVRFSPSGPAGPPPSQREARIFRIARKPLPTGSSLLFTIVIKAWSQTADVQAELLGLASGQDCGRRPFLIVGVGTLGPMIVAERCRSFTIKSRTGCGLGGDHRADLAQIDAFNRAVTTVLFKRSCPGCSTALWQARRDTRPPAQYQGH